MRTETGFGEHRLPVKCPPTTRTKLCRAQIQNRDQCDHGEEKRQNEWLPIGHPRCERPEDHANAHYEER